MGFFNSKQEIAADISGIQLPEHIGIIMDGNGRWAKKRGLPRTAGHKAGAEVFRKIARYCSDIGIRHLTMYAFSTENWSRPQQEVDTLMRYFKDYLEEALRDFADNTIALRFIGDISRFSPELQELMIKNQTLSAVHEGMILNHAMNYGGRAELVHAFKEMSRKIASGELSEDDIDEKLISEYLYTKGQPDPDLIIRPSGEHRTSNFLLWQSAYSEYYIDDVLWPDYTPEHLNKALVEFSKRSRRFGGV